MTRERSVDERIGAWLLESAPDQLPNRVLRATFERTRAGRQRRTLPGWGSILARRTNAAALAVGATAIALIVVGVILPPRTNPSLGGDAGQTPITSATLPTTSPTLEPTATPSPTPTPILWTEARLKEDWPAPVRAEPVGGSIVKPMPETTPDVNGNSERQYTDPSGDTESAVFPWVDIREVRLSTAPYLYIHPVSSPPRVDPTEQWIAYGVVFDEDRDGVPDWRYGMDNRPVTKDDNQGIRAWRTDLHTGRTETDPPYYNGVAGVVLDTYWDYDDSATFVFGGEVTGDGTAGKKMDVPFYVWASMIQDGRVVATDYSPDVGWLDPGSGPQVERSPDPTPSPGPTPRVVDDPDVPGGRLWTVTVVNKSAQPATFVVAELTATGRAGRPVGTVTPSIVPAGATKDVTFALPAEGSSGWAIFANPGPDIGPMFMGSDVPLAGEIRIGADGNMGWLSP